MKQNGQWPEASWPAWDLPKALMIRMGDVCRGQIGKRPLGQTEEQEFPLVCDWQPLQSFNNKRVFQICILKQKQCGGYREESQSKSQGTGRLGWSQYGRTLSDSVGPGSGLGLVPPPFLLVPLSN